MNELSFFGNPTKIDNFLEKSYFWSTKIKMHWAPNTKKVEPNWIMIGPGPIFEIPVQKQKTLTQRRRRRNIAAISAPVTLLGEMANQGAKKRKDENARHMARLRRIIIACNVLFLNTLALSYCNFNSLC